MKNEQFKICGHIPADTWYRVCKLNFSGDNQNESKRAPRRRMDVKKNTKNTNKVNKKKQQKTHKIQFFYCVQKN